MTSTTAAAPNAYRGADRLIFGIVLAVVTFWLFAQTTLNVAPTMRDELRISESLMTFTFLLAGQYMVVAFAGFTLFGVAISAALFTALGELGTTFTAMSDLFLGRTDNVAVRFAAAVALLFNVLMVVIAIIAVIMTVPKDDRGEGVNV